MMRHVAKVAALAMAVLVTAAVSAREDRPKINNDGDFLAHALECGTCGVKCSEIAAKKASDEKVRDFAQRMAKEHTAMNDKLADRAKDLKLGVVAGLDKESRAKCDNLAKQTGADVDRTYLKMVIEGHEKAIAMCEDENKVGKDANVKSFATDAIPTLKKHLKEARELADRVK